MVDVSLLGPIEVRVDGVPVVLGGPKQRLVLAALALRPGTYVTRSQIVDVVWPADPPTSARHTVESYVSRLRSLVRGHGIAAEFIRSRGDAYALTGADVDSVHFEAQATRGASHIDGGDLLAGVQLLDEALGMWRGPALACIREATSARTQADALDESRIAVVEAWASASLQLGRQGDVGSRLRVEVQASPARQRLSELLMLALYRAGDHVGALEVYHSARLQLLELGLEPSGELLRLESRILLQDPTLALTRPPEQTVVGRIPAPADSSADSLVFPVTGPLAPTSTPFVGRDHDVNALGAVLQDAATNATQIVVLSGDPGVGKTRLCAEFARHANRKGASVLYGRCDEEPLFAYQPFVESLRQYVTTTPPEILADHVSQVTGELRRIVPEFGQRVPDLPYPLPGDPDGARFRLFEAAVTLLTRAAARRPLVLVIDDLHWADPGTLQLLRYLSRDLRPSQLMILTTCRSADADLVKPVRHLLADLRRERDVEPTPLAPLDLAGVTTLARRMTGAPASSPGAERALFEQTDGNPFFVVELLRSRRTSAAGPSTTGAAPAGDTVVVPRRVTDVIARRLDRLPPDTTRRLDDASVIGRDFSADLLADMALSEPEVVVAELEPAVQAGLILEAEGLAGRYTFSHALTRQSVYQHMTVGTRAVAHRRLARAIKSTPADDASHDAVLAHHFSMAGSPSDLASAIEHGLRAGHEATQSMAHEQAAVQFASVLATMDRAGTDDAHLRCDVATLLGDAQRRAGDAGYRRTLLEAARAAEALGDGPRLYQAAITNSRGFFSSVQGTDTERIRMLRAALASQPEDDERARALLMATLSVELISGPAWTERSALSDAALAMARRAGDDETLSRVLVQRFSTLWGPGTVDERRANAAEATMLASHAGAPATAFYGAMFESHAAMEQGDIDAAARCAATSGRLAANLRQPIMDWYQAVTVAKLESFVGSPASAERAARAACDLGVSSSQPDAIAWFLVTVFSDRLLRGALAAADPCLPEIFAVPWIGVADSPEFTDDNPSVERLIRATTSATYAELGRSEDAEAHLTETMNLLQEPMTHDFSSLAVLAIASIACAHLGRREHARLLHERLLPHADAIVDCGPGWIGHTEHHLAVLATTLGRLDEADVRFARAAAVYQRLGARAWLARLQLQWSDLLTVRDERADRSRAADLRERSAATAGSIDIVPARLRAAVSAGR